MLLGFAVVNTRFDFLFHPLLPPHFQLKQGRLQGIGLFSTTDYLLCYLFSFKQSTLQVISHVFSPDYLFHYLFRPKQSSLQVINYSRCENVFRAQKKRLFLLLESRVTGPKKIINHPLTISNLMCYYPDMQRCIEQSSSVHLYYFNCNYEESVTTV